MGDAQPCTDMLFLAKQGWSSSPWRQAEGWSVVSVVTVSLMTRFCRSQTPLLYVDWLVVTPTRLLNRSAKFRIKMLWNSLPGSDNMTRQAPYTQMQ